MSTQETAAAVSWFGYGRMGEAMVERLLAADVPVQVWNRSPSRLESLKTPGATILRWPSCSRCCAASAAPAKSSLRIFGTSSAGRSRAARTMGMP